MIYGSSADSVLIKKIAVKIWLLKDEVESVTRNSYQRFDDKSKLKTLLTDEYSPTISGTPKLKLIDGDQGDSDGEKQESSEENTKSEQPLGENKIIQRRSKNIKDDKIFNGVVILSEIEMNRIHFFCNRKFSIGQSIVIEFQIPQLFSITSEIIYCHNFNMRTNIIGKNKFEFRVIANYIFLKKGERTLLRNFVSSIEPEIIAPEKKESKENKSTGDSFDELDGLDL